MKNYLKHLLVAIPLLAASGAAHAITAKIIGAYATSGAYVVNVGQQIEIEGTCKTNATEGRNHTAWYVDDKPYFEDKAPPLVTGIKFTVEGPEGRDINVTMYCHTSSLIWSDDQATRVFRIRDSTPPAVSWDNKTTYANSSIAIEPIVRDTTSHIVGDAQLRWTENGGGMSPGIRIVETEMLDDGRGGRFRYELDTSGMSEGRKNVEIRASDVVKNDTGWIPLGNFIVDRTAPSLSDMTVSKSGTTIKATMPRIADAVSGVANVWIRWQTGDGWSSDYTAMRNDGDGAYSYEIDTHGVSAGLKKIQVRARDGAGNDTGWVEKGSFANDHKGPDVDWSNANAEFARDDLRVRVYSVALPGYSVAEVWVRWDGAPAGGYKMSNDGEGYFSYTIPTAGMRNGSKQYVELWAKDNGGGVRDWYTPWGAWFTVDKSAPSIRWDNANPAFTNGSTTIKADVSDAGSGVGDVWITWTGETSKTVKMANSGGSQYSYTIPALSAGVKEVQIWASDKLGNNTGWARKGSFIVDKTAPVVNWFAPLDQAVLTDDRVRIAGNLVEAHPDAVTIEWQAEDESAWQSHVEKLKAGSNDFDYELGGLKRGVNYRLRMQAIDKAGNTSAMTPVRTVIGQLPAKVLFKSAQLAVLDGSLVDKDDSGGLSAGDDLVYAVELEAADIDAAGVSLRYALPPGLALTPDLHPYFAPDSAIADGAKLNPYWNGDVDTQLLIYGVDLPANRKLIVRIPVTITSALAAPVDSAILAGARNARDEWRLEHSLSLQDKYPAHRALDLTLASMQPNWKYLPGTAFDYRIAVRARGWDLSDVELRYALPPGLERNGDLHIEGDGAAAVKLNPAWSKGDDKLLLSSISGVKLPAGHAFDVIVPVKIGGKAAPSSTLQSDIETRASNLDGPVTATHRIVLERSTAPEEQLVLEKTVDRKNAKPGDTLRYTIRFQNVGIDTLHDPVIKDAIQTDYLTLQKAQCDASISIALQCSVVEGLPPGELEWCLDGKLEAGDFGSVSYEATVNRR